MARQKHSRPTRKVKVQALASAAVTALAGLAAALGWFDLGAETIDAVTVLVAAVLVPVIPAGFAWLTPPNAKDGVER